MQLQLLSCSVVHNQAPHPTGFAVGRAWSLFVNEMYEHYKIQEVVWPFLEKAGFRIKSEDSEIDYCGSVRTIFVNHEKRVLLEWDGEEGFGYAEVWKNNV